MAPKRKRVAATDGSAEQEDTNMDAAPDTNPAADETEATRTPAAKPDGNSSSSSTTTTTTTVTTNPKIVTDDSPVHSEDLDGRDAERRPDVQGNTSRSAEDDGGRGVNGEAGKMRLPPPPQAGLVDPVGYKTNKPPEGRAVRVYADGVFDLFHLGHMRALQQAKTAFPNTVLVVGVTGDRETHRRKGLTVLSAAERAESVRHCRWVDEVIEDCPWIVTPEFLDEHNLDYVAHDDIPYGASEGDDIYASVKAAGKFLVTQRTEGVSTTGIITKIVRDYESYISRQLSRGQSRKELNISWLKKNELDIKRHVNEIRDSIKQNWTTTGQELGREFRTFWGPSRPGSPAVGMGVGGGTPGEPARGRKRKSEFLTSPVTPAAQHHAGQEMGGGGGSGRAAQSPGGWSKFSVGTGSGRDRDFVAGYAMGLLGSVRGWMQRNRRNLNDAAPHDDLLSPRDSGSGSEDEQHDHNNNRKAAINGGGGGNSVVVDRLEASVAEQQQQQQHRRDGGGGGGGEEDDVDAEASARGRKRGRVSA